MDNNIASAPEKDNQVPRDEKPARPKQKNSNQQSKLDKQPINSHDKKLKSRNATNDSSGSNRQTLKTKTSSIETHKFQATSTINDFEMMDKIGKCTINRIDWLICVLGDGAYSEVYKVKRLEDGIEYALKKVKLDHLSDKERDNAINEVRILASVQHPNVI